MESLVDSKKKETSLKVSIRADVWTRRRILSASAGAIAASLAAPSFAQGFPVRPVSLIVGTPAGGINDQVMRTASVDAAKKLGQPIIVDNRPGAAGIRSFLAIKAAAPDGYTIGVATPALWRQPILEDVGFDPLRDFTYIINLAESIFAVVVREDSPLRSWSDLLAFSRTNPGAVSYGAPPGLNQTSHILMEGVARHEQMKWEPVPYKGSSDSITALLGGHIAFSVEPLVSVSAMVRTGKARFLAVASGSRLKSWPNVPTLKELGYPIYTVDTPAGLVGPANLPADNVRILHEAFKFALEQPSLINLLDRSDQSTRYMAPAEYASFVAHAAQEQKDLLTAYGMAKKR